MEAVCCGKRWDVALAHNDSGDIIGAMPYLLGKKAGLRYIVQPQLTQYNGPWYSSGDRNEQMFADSQLAEETAKAAADSDFIILQDVPADNSYIPAVSVFDRFDKSRRQRQIRRAEKSLFADPDITPELFARFHTDYWQSRGEKDLLSQDFMVRTINAAKQRGQGILLALRDSEGTLQAARFVAFDDNCAYALLSALHPQHPNGASALLFWLILQQLSGKCRSFDFEGSMDPNIAFSYSLYGAQPTTYYQLTRCSIPFLRKLLKI